MTDPTAGRAAPADDDDSHAVGTRPDSHAVGTRPDSHAVGTRPDNGDDAGGHPGDGLLVVARIGRPHGVRGELTVEVRTDDPEDRFLAGRRLLTDPAGVGPLEVCRSFLHSGRWVLSFAGVGDRAAAESLRDTLLLVDPAELPEIEDPDEFYDHQLVGLRVQLPDARVIGTLTEVVHGPAGDLLVIDRDGREVLVPFRREMVPTVDVTGGRVVIDPPDGMLDL